MQLPVFAPLILCLSLVIIMRAAPANSTVPKLPEIGGRIVGGISVTIEQYPYQLSLRVGNSHICGASIIHTSWALTAAHCAQNAVTSMTLKAGSTNRNTGGTVYAVMQKIVHSQYNSATYDFDIALLKTKTAFVYSPTIKNIALPAQDTAVAASTNATVSGWGTLSAGGSTLPSNLQAVSVPIVSQASCIVSYPGSITARMICAGFTSGGKDSCQGDSGGPLVAVLGNVKQLIGVVSWGYSCAKPNYPGVYTNVANLRSWIKTNTGNVV